MSSAVIQEAMSLARSGRPLDGVLELRAAQSRGDAEAHLLEGLWLVEGRFVPRDLAPLGSGSRTPRSWVISVLLERSTDSWPAESARRRIGHKRFHCLSHAWVPIPSPLASSTSSAE